MTRANASKSLVLLSARAVNFQLRDLFVSHDIEPSQIICFSTDG